MSYRPFTDLWLLARPKVKYFGAYPAGFLQRARDLLACGKDDLVLHVCAGAVREYRCGPGCKGTKHYHGFGHYDLTWDLDRRLWPDIIADVRDGNSWRRVASDHEGILGVLADPPYSREFAANYAVGAEVLPSPSSIVHHAVLDLLPVGGRVGVLSLECPRYPKQNARQIAIVAVYVGNGNVGRTFAVFERTA